MSAYSQVLLLFGIAGHWEILVIGGVVLLLFLGRRVPEVMRSLGRGVTQFKKGLRETDDQTQAQVDTEDSGRLPNQQGTVGSNSEDLEKTGDAASTHSPS